MPLGVMMMGLAPNVWVPTIGLFLVDLGHAGLHIDADSHAVVIEKLTGKKFLASLRGAWSIYLCSGWRFRDQCFNSPLA